MQALSKLHTTKSGKLINVYQRCDSCDNLLGVPATAKRLGISTKECTKCGQANNVKYFQRWCCLECGKTFIDPSEWQRKEQLQQDPLKAIYETWTEIRRTILERDDYRCQVCGKINSRLDVHHIVPRRDGGQDTSDNLITVCNGGCHQKIEPFREKFTLSITGDGYHRMSNLVGNLGNDGEMIIRLCEELEKLRLRTIKHE